MSYPTPSIYTYRVSQVTPSRVSGNQLGYFVAQYSADSGTTFKPINAEVRQSLNEAMQLIQFVVENEASFQNMVNNPTAHDTFPIVATVVTYAYPPS